MLSEQRYDRSHGCILGGAVGDALGAPVEFMTLQQIRDKYGPDGIRDMDVAYNVLGAITDDTQMAMATARGILNTDEPCEFSIIESIWNAYLDWHATQENWEDRRAPGNTCMSSLGSGKMGTLDKPINDSKGCGGVMRAAPIGVFYAGMSFPIAAEAAATTHGHPSGYLSAGYLAHLISRLVRGADIEEAMSTARGWLGIYNGYEETLEVVLEAESLSKISASADIAIEKLGEGWTGHEALAIALFCALRAQTFEEGVYMAVNHGGDSDSTGAIAGNILGAMYGKKAVPRHWLLRMERKGKEIVHETTAALLNKLNLLKEKAATL